MAQRRRRSGGFGFVISKGTATHPAFAIRWREGRTHKQKSGFKTRTDAMDALARIRTGLGDGTLVDKRRAVVSFETVAKQWLDLHSKPNLRSHQDNVERYELHLKPFFADCPLTAITPTRVLELRAKLQMRVTKRMRRDAEGELVPIDWKMKPRTVNLVMALLRSILRFAATNGHIAASPTDRLGRGKLMLPLEKVKLSPPIATAADAGRLLAALQDIEREKNRPGLHALFATLLFTGMRRGEAMGLRWADVDLDRRMITVRRSYNSLTKSGKQRTVPVATPLVAILKDYRIADPWHGELVFPNEAGQMYSRNAKLEDLLDLALERAVLPRITVHQLRHAMASFFVMNGGDIFTLQKILGHSTPQLVSDTYAHLSQEHLAGEADRLAFPAPKRAADVIPFAGRADSGTKADSARIARRLSAKVRKNGCEKGGESRMISVSAGEET